MVLGVEPAVAISDAEARFERVRRSVGLWLAAPVFGLVWLAAGDGKDGRLAAIMALAAVLWISEAIPPAVTALLAAALTVLIGVATPKEAFGAFGHPLLFLFIGSFFLAEAMVVHGLGERFARAAHRVARGRMGSLVALSVATFALSLFMSNTAATAVVLPVAVAVARADGHRGFGAALVLAIAYAASVGGIGTPVGTPPNLIAIERIRDAGIEIGFLRWMALGLPIGLVMLAVLFALFARRFDLQGGAAVRVPGSSGPWSRGELAVATAFSTAVLLWVLPGVLELALPGHAFTVWVGARLDEPVVAVLAAALLFVWPIGRDADGEPRRALGWAQAARIDWGTVLLFGGGILLGELAGKTGLSAKLGDALVAASGADSLWTLTALITATSILLSEATSNTATATLMLPIAISIAAAADVPLAPPALGAAFGSSFGFTLPISTAPNAMAYGTGRVTIRQMAGAGIIFDVIGFLVILAGLRLLCPLLGLV